MTVGLVRKTWSEDLSQVKLIVKKCLKIHHQNHHPSCTFLGWF